MKQKIYKLKIKDHLIDSENIKLTSLRILCLIISELRWEMIRNGLTNSQLQHDRSDHVCSTWFACSGDQRFFLDIFRTLKL